MEEAPMHYQKLNNLSY